MLLQMKCNLLILTTCLQQIVWFLLPVVLFALLTKRNPIHYMKSNTLPSANKFFLWFGIFIVSYFLIYWVEIWNMNLHFPESFAALEAKLRMLEEMAKITTQNLIGSPNNATDVLTGILALAVLPSICEEAIFRGGLLNGMLKSRVNIHVAVWVTAFIFSFIHFQFFGFFPRLLLGAVLGYAFAYTQSIWTGVFLHFVNNFAAIIIMYYFPKMTP
jgi:membrane protease YdiL (CAAX protease family)